ncbi:Sin3 histone deacetylase corepressor complex component SDS3 [Schistosoma japonicum]|nr:Sin3 histone deacetylase corepressor complex component SDS3 [Schistosoma japonicum]KAH8875311.1 Sin3 histone deacetylase corepressor complex component SDS3 [Schistosoma japonicum]KAH8875312.1 Sin3 histone deacetylase corepressor complex component SDS3 [Schistosoma japonicum]KAH8875313.1 Sin3 histone deacetylase corepressor complex component SDS3 [Schistosoma japonicum]KAH8875315.1 Sin3 histone deacetylase corepressor complex component SDS3 [Schistosoma japonicum]
MKRKHTEKSGYVSASVISAVAQDLSDDFEDTYNSEMACIQTQLDQLDNKTHPEFVKIREEIENWYAEQKQRIQILHEHKLDTIYREYTKEAEACDRDCEHEKRRIQAYLVSLCEELKRRLEHDKKSIELTPSGDILELKPAITRKLRRRAVGGGGGGSGVGGGGIDVSTSNPANFMYWGDLLLCSSRWPVNSTLNTRKLQKSDSHGSRDNNDENTDPVQPSSNVENESKADASIDVSATSRSNVVSSVFESTPATTIGTTRTGSTFNSTAKTNLFGSLGLNPFDGNLLSHLLASMNSSAVASSSSLANFYPNASDNVNGVNNFLPSGVNSSSCGPAAAAVAAVAAGLIIPSCSGGPTESVCLSNNVGLSPAAAVAALGCGLVPLLNNNSASSTTSARKRRHQNTTPSAQLNLLLPEHEIYADLTIIHRACSKISNTSNSTNGTVTGSRKHASHATNNNNISNNNNSNTSQLSYHSPVSPLGKCYEENISSSRMIKDSNSTIVAPLISSSNSIGSPNSFTGSEDLSVIRTNTRSTTGSVGAGVNSSTNQSNTSFSIWIDDGRLYCGHKCYQIGASVILEGRDGSSHRCAGTIVSIGVQDIAIRRSSDHGICRVTVQQLKQGRYALWPNKNE